MSFIKKLKIGNVELENNLILAPMAGVTDMPFRVLCKEAGVGLVCTEMVSAKALNFKNKKCDELLTVNPEEKPVSVQLFGNDPIHIYDAVKKLEERDFAIIDFNMGCPVPKVVNNNEGSALMKDPFLVEKIVTTLVKASSRPVTVKIRKGFDESRINAVQIAKIIEESGASAVAVHGRTREEMYSGHADWDIIRQVKESVSIPVIGNGDVTDPLSCKQMIEETGCDGVMIARGAKGKPWIFKEILDYDRTGVLPQKKSVEELVPYIIRHVEMDIAYKGEYIALREMRKQISWYTAGYRGSSSLRGAINTADSLDEIKAILSKLVDD